nr:hypothetical protein [uncultured Dyadobacter sp.]
MVPSDNTFLLRLAVIVILLMHSIPGMFDNGVNDFGNFYLNQKGFAPFGVPLAWAIKLSHVAAVVCLATGKYVKWACVITIIVLVAGIVMVHGPEGWYLVGGGRNGVEFNFLLIAVLLAILFPNGFGKRAAR